MHTAFPFLQAVADVAFCVAEHGLPYRREIHRARGHVPVPHALLGGMQHRLPAGLQGGFLGSQRLLAVPQLAAPALHEAQAQSNGNPRQQPCHTQRPGARAPGGEHLAPVPRDGRNQRLVHVQVRRKDGAQRHQPLGRVRLHRADEEAFHPPAVQVRLKERSGLRQRGAQQPRPFGHAQEAHAVAVHQGALHVGGVAHGIQQGLELVGVQRRRDHAAGQPIFRHHRARQRDGPDTQHRAHGRTDDQRGLLAACQSPRRLEVIAVGKVLPEQFGAAGGDHRTLGIQHGQRAHAGHGVAEGPQPLVEWQGAFRARAPLRQVRNNIPQRLVHGMQLALQVLMDDMHLVRDLLALAFLGVAPLQAQYDRDQRPQRQPQARQQPPLPAKTLGLRIRSLAQGNSSMRAR